MRQSIVFLNDYVSDRRVSITFKADDYDAIDEHWEEEDQRLLSYQHLEPFKGRTRYCDLGTQHLRVMIQQVLLHYTGLNDQDRADDYHPVVKLLNHLLLSLIRRIETSTDTSVEILHVHRISEQNIVFDFTAAMNMNFIKPKPKEDHDPFTIVVDNTK